MPQNSILAIHQDKWGFIWMGTDDGLARFDGYRFLIYRHDSSDPKSIKNNVIRSITEDSNGLIWVGTEGGGINILNPKTGEFHSLDLTLSSEKKAIFSKTSTLLKDSRGNIWVGTNGYGVYQISGFDKLADSNSLEDLDQLLEVKSYNRSNSELNDNKVWNIYEDLSGTIWIGTLDGGAYRIKPGGLEPQKIELLDKGVPVTSIKNFFEDSKGTFWIGTERNGIFIQNKTSSDFIPFSLPQKRKEFQQVGLNITSFKEDVHGKIWIGTLGRGLYVFDREFDHISHYEDDPSDPYSLNGNSVYTIFEDYSGNIWLGMYSGEGLNKTNPGQQQFEHYRYDPTLQRGLSAKMVKSILKDVENNLWIGLFNGGLNFLREGTDQFQYFTANESGGLKHNHVQVLLQASDKRVWIGTDGGGISIYDLNTGKFEHLLHDPENPNSLSKNEVWAILEDHRGNIWIGTANGGGLNLYNPTKKQFTRFFHEPDSEQSLLFNDVRALYQDSKNNIWIGTYGGGLSKLNPESMEFEHFKYGLGKKGLSHGMVTSILEDSSGFIWVGTFGGGLNRINPLDGSVRIFREIDGLPSDVVKAVLEDNSGQLWISTVNGISSFDKTQVQFKNFTEDDGLQSDEFNLGSAFKDSEGKLYFGGTNGMNAFFPERIQANPTPNAPLITLLKVLNQTVLPGQKIMDKVILNEMVSFTDRLEFRHFHNSFEFEFSSLEFQSQEKISFFYMLEGYDPDWIQTDSRRRFANYANLPSGKYTFKIKASIENDANFSPESVLEIEVFPPWYKSTWAYILYSILLLIIGYSVKSLVSWRIKLKNDLRFERIEHQKHEEINQLKLRFFTNISHELRTPLMLIKAPLEQLLVRNDVAPGIKRQLEIIYANADRLLRLINQLLEFRKQETGNVKLTVQAVNLRRFMDKIRNSFEAIANQRGIEFSFDMAPESTRTIWIDADQMEKVFYNLIYNAFKFTPNGGNINISVSKQSGEDPNENWITIKVKDNGKGIPKDQLPLIFERFFQVKQHGSYQEIGTGIGLALSKNIIELHHGKVEVSSEQGVETVFSVYIKDGYEHFDKECLVHDPEDNASKSIISQEDADLLLIHESQPAITPLSDNLKKELVQGKKLLIVEDNPDLLALLTSVLESHFETFTAINGEQGIEQALSISPDFIISDVMMPVMDGIEMCKNLKENVKTSHIPIILLTAKSSHIHQREGYESGADDYITKPFHLDLLVLKINNLLNSREKLQLQFAKTPNLEPSKIQISPADEVFLQQAISVIESNMDNTDFSIGDFVKELGLSRTLLFEKFKALVGQTPNDFITIIRLKRAAQLLLESEYKVAEIAYMVGYNNPKYFSKIFAKQFGSSPSKFKDSGSTVLSNGK